MAFIQNSLLLLYHHQLILPRRDSGDWFRHVFRELNTRADEAARVAYTHNKPHSTISDFPIQTCQRIRAAFDGGRQQDIASIGWVLEASTCSDDSVPWRRIATAGVPFGDRTVPEAELAAACEVVMAIAAFLSGAIEIDSTSGLVAGPALTRFPFWRQPQFDR